MKYIVAIFLSFLFFFNCRGCCVASYKFCQVLRHDITSAVTTDTSVDYTSRIDPCGGMLNQFQIKNPCEMHAFEFGRLSTYHLPLISAGCKT